MLKILIKTDSHYSVNRKKIKQAIKDFLKAKNIKQSVEISLSVVGDRMMRRLNKKYRNLDETANVLAFPLFSTKKANNFVMPPDGHLYLGDILISYPQMIDQACAEEKLVDEKINELVLHGLKNLLGNTL